MLDRVRFRVVAKTEEENGPVDILIVDGNGLSIRVRATGKRAGEIGLRDVRVGATLVESLEQLLSDRPQG